MIVAQPTIGQDGSTSSETYKALAMGPTAVSPDSAPIVPLHCQYILADQQSIVKLFDIVDHGAGWPVPMH